MKTQINSLKISLVLVVLFLSNMLNAQDTIVKLTPTNETKNINYIIGTNHIYLSAVSTSYTLTLHKIDGTFIYEPIFSSNITPITYTTVVLTPNTLPIVVNKQATLDITTSGTYTVYIKVQSLTTTYYKTLIINASISTSIKSQQSQSLGLKVFPNPSTDKVNITGNNLKTVVVYNVTGDAIITKDEAIVTEQIMVSLEDYAAGVYYIKISDDYNQTSIKKIVKL